MSAGHESHPATGALSSHTIDRILTNPAIREHVYRSYDLDHDHDLPYLAGYSKDGKTIYIDRHLPEHISYVSDGLKKEFNPSDFVKLHEILEKACIDVLGWGYYHAHEAANGYERRAVMRAGLLWTPYNKALAPYIKADEHEKLKKVPADLDMTPYYAPPVNKKLVAHMKKVMKS